jgi:hypothetical protein
VYGNTVKSNNAVKHSVAANAVVGAAGAAVVSKFLGCGNKEALAIGAAFGVAIAYGAGVGLEGGKGRAL